MHYIQWQLRTGNEEGDAALQSGQEAAQQLAGALECPFAEQFQKEPKRLFAVFILVYELFDRLVMDTNYNDEDVDKAIRDTAFEMKNHIHEIILQ